MPIKKTTLFKRSTYSTNYNGTDIMFTTDCSPPNTPSKTKSKPSTDADVDLSQQTLTKRFGPYDGTDVMMNTSAFSKK